MTENSSTTDALGRAAAIERRRRDLAAARAALQKANGTEEVTRARDRVAEAEGELARLRSAPKIAPDAVHERLEELSDVVARIRDVHPRAIARARTIRGTYIDTLREVFRAPALVAMAAAEAQALAALYDLDAPDPPPDLEISPETRTKLLDLGLTAIAREAHEEYAVVARALLRAVSDLSDPDLADRSRPFEFVTEVVTSSSRPLVEALQRRIQELGGEEAAPEDAAVPG